MGLLPLTQTEVEYLKQLIREVIDERKKPRQRKKSEQYNGSPPDPTVLAFVELYFSPTYDTDILGYELPYDLYCSFPKAPPLTRIEFAKCFRKACMQSDKLGIVEMARTSQMKGLRWVRFATDEEIRERQAKEKQ